MNRRPSGFLFISVLLGAFIGFSLPKASLWLIAVASCALLILLVRNDTVRILGFLFFALFMVAFSASRERELFDVKIAALPQQETAFIGVLRKFSKKEDGSLSALVDATYEGDPSHTFRLSLRLKNQAASIKLKNGQQIFFTGQARAYKKPLSPVLFDGYRYGLAHGLHGNMIIRDSNMVWLGEKISKAFFADAQRKLFNLVVFALSPREASLLLALINGDTDLFSDEQNEIYRNIGAQHLLAVSGLQVTLIAALIYFFLMPIFALLLPLFLSHYAQLCAAIATLIATFFFIGLSGFTASATRAFMMASIMLLPTVFPRRIDLYDAFFVSGLLSILLMPTLVLDLGYLLSYAAVFGLLLAHHRTESLRQALMQRSHLLSWSVSLALSSMAAFLATLPILAIFFRKVAVFSVLSNLLLVPLASFLQVPAICFGLVGGLLDSRFFIKAASLFSNSIEVFAEFLAESLGRIIYLPPLSSIALGFSTAAGFLFFLAALKPSRFLLMSSLMLLSFPLAELILKKSPFEIVVIPVGQGDSTLITMPSKKYMLIDAGGQMSGDFDPGESIVLPTLLSKGINALDVLAITHPDPDHILGAFFILDNIAVKEIWHSGYSPQHPLTERLVKVAKDKNIAIKSACDLLGSHKFGSTIVEVLAPAAINGDPYFVELSSNDNSLVLRVVHDGFAFLWPGDIEYFGEGLLLSRDLNLSAHVLKAPHHGSRTSSSLAFIEAVDPKHVIYSTGAFNRFKFPHDEVVNRYQSLGVLQWDTAKDGAITIRVEGERFFINGFRRLFKENSHQLI